MGGELGFGRRWGFLREMVLLEDGRLNEGFVFEDDYLACSLKLKQTKLESESFSRVCSLL
jgi:hypothetical protein